MSTGTLLKNAIGPDEALYLTSRLQSASPGSTTLLRTNAEAGHGIGSSLAQRIEEGVDVYSFLFHALNVSYRQGPHVRTR